MILRQINGHRKRTSESSGASSAVGFSIAGKGYIATGYDGNYLKDIWEFDPANGTDGAWTQRA